MSSRSEDSDLNHGLATMTKNFSHHKFHKGEEWI